MKRYFYFIIPIIVCVVTLSFSIRVKAVNITPYDYSGYYLDTSAMDYLSRLSGVDLLSIFHANYANDTAGVAYSVSPLSEFTSAADDMVVTFNSYILDDNNNVIGYNVTYQNVRVHYWNGSGQLVFSDYSGNNVYYLTCYFNDLIPTGNTSAMRVVLLNEDYLPFTLNNVPFVINGYSSDDGPGFSSSFLGNLTSNGHSSSGTGIEGLENFNWSVIGGVLNPSGHSHTISQNASYDFTVPVQNLLGQIVNNTNELINNTYNLGEVIKGLANNMVKGFGALFNGLSTLNDNIINGFEYLTEKPNFEEINDAVTSSKGYQLKTSASEVMTSAKTLVMYVANGVSSTQQQTLVIPLDFTNWSFSSEYGRIAPFSQVYVMRFEYLEDTKTLWQPLFLGLLYFSIAVFIYFDIPNLFRGAANV